MGLLSSIGGIFKSGVTSIGNLLNKGSGTYQSPILSVAGQKERLTNVVSTFKSVLTGGGVRVNRNVIKNETVAKAIEKVASHPFISAGVAAGGIMGAKRVISLASSSSIKPSGILNTAKPTVNTQQSVQSSPSESQSILTSVLDKKDNPNINAVAQGASVMLGGESNYGVSGKKSIKTTRRKARKRKVRYPKRRSSKRKARNKKRSRVTRRKGKVRYTKKGQPYVIQRNGRARFIKKKKR
jgi:hypothetical protein